MTAPKVKNGSRDEGLHLDDIILDPRRKTVGVVTRDPIFRAVSASAFSQQGYSPKNLTLNQLVGTNLPQDAITSFYLIDLTSLPDYTNVEEAIKIVRKNSPDSELILVGTKVDMRAPKSGRLRKFAESQLVPQYYKPAPPELPGATNGRDYEEKLQALERSYNNQVYEKKLKDFIDSVTHHFVAYLSRPSMIKVGGSIFDLIPQTPNVLNMLLDEVAKLHQQGYRMILSAGGGLRQDTERVLSVATGEEPDSLSVLERQARHIASILGKDAVYVPPDDIADYEFSYESLGRVMPVISLSGIRNISQGESDKHTLALAERLGLPKVIFAKNTEGVYKWDPNVDYQALAALNNHSTTQLFFGAENVFYPTINASAVADGAIDRRSIEKVGDKTIETGNHLIETGALLELKNKTKYLRAVHIINGTKPELLRQALEGSASTGKIVGSYIQK